MTLGGQGNRETGGGAALAARAEPPDQRTEWMQCQRTSREQPFVTNRKRGERLIERETLNVP